MLCCRRMNVGDALTNLLYPPACLLCRERFPSPQPGGSPASEVACERCLQAMPRSGPPVCRTCGVGLPGAFDAIVQCETCQRAPPAFEQARAPWGYLGPAREAVRQFKYRHRWRIGRWLAQTMVTTAQSTFPLEEIAAVLPVPLYWLKRRLKGCNPAEQLAEAVAHSLEKPCLPDALRRVRWTSTQTRLQWRARVRNVRRAFVAQERLVQKRSVLLIDDVLTSGATVNACALALKEAGAQNVFVLTAARTPIA